MPAHVLRVTAVEDHPKKGDTVSVVTVAHAPATPFQFVAQKIAKMSGSVPRYSVGQLVLFVPGGNLLPLWLLKRGFYDEATGKGFLEGKLGNRVKAQNFGGVRSEGVHFELIEHGPNAFALELENGDQLPVVEGQDLGVILGLVEFIDGKEVPQTEAKPLLTPVSEEDVAKILPAD